MSDARYISVSPYRRYNPTVVHVQGQNPQSITGETLRPYIKLFSSLLGVTPVHIKIIPPPCSIIMPCRGNPTPPRIPERIPAPLVPVVGDIRGGAFSPNQTLKQPHAIPLIEIMNRISAIFYPNVPSSIAYTTYATMRLTNRMQPLMANSISTSLAQYAYRFHPTLKALGSMTSESSFL